jgi:hypothetical protein
MKQLLPHVHSMELTFPKALLRLSNIGQTETQELL